MKEWRHSFFFSNIKDTKICIKKSVYVSKIHLTHNIYYGIVSSTNDLPYSLSSIY